MQPCLDLTHTVHALRATNVLVDSNWEKINVQFGCRKTSASRYSAVVDPDKGTLGTILQKQPCFLEAKVCGEACERGQQDGRVSGGAQQRPIFLQAKKYFRKTRIFANKDLVSFFAFFWKKGKEILSFEIFFHSHFPDGVSVFFLFWAFSIFAAPECVSEDTPHPTILVALLWHSCGRIFWSWWKQHKNSTFCNRTNKHFLTKNTLSPQRLGTDPIPAGTSPDPSSRPKKARCPFQSQVATVFRLSPSRNQHCKFTSLRSSLRLEVCLPSENIQKTCTRGKSTTNIFKTLMQGWLRVFLARQHGNQGSKILPKISWTLCFFAEAN